MSYIESTKNYTGGELETIFFRPMLTGDAAADLGVKVIYNMPVPTTISIFKGSENLLQTNDGSGWGGTTSTKSQKTIEMARVKAEMSYAASDYFSLVFDNLATKDSLNEEDLTGSQLEAAETEIFRRSIADSLRASVWLGDTTSGNYKTFDGLLKLISAPYEAETYDYYEFAKTDLATTGIAVKLFDKCWDEASATLRDMKADGQLVYYVTSDIYALYEKELDSSGTSASYTESVNGRQGLLYHGIEVYNVRLEEALASAYPSGSFVLLTDRRNLVVAVNTADFPGSEIRMWYNPDEMENRQRASFAVGCQVVDMSIVSAALCNIV
ncbi:MAG: hypothetical protein SNH88_07120 [Rikenellaceae bacterium]